MAWNTVDEGEMPTKQVAAASGELAKRYPDESELREVAMRPGREAVAYMDRHEAGSRVQRFDFAMRTYAKAHGMDLARTIVDQDGRGARQLFDILGRCREVVVLIPTRWHLQYFSFSEIALQADDVIEVCAR